MIYIHLGLLLIAFVSCVFGGGGPIDTPIDTTPPSLAGGSIANAAPPGPFFRDFNPPFPTDAWWSGLTVRNQNSTLAGPFPYQSRTTNTGLSFGLSDHRAFDNRTSIHVNTQFDFQASLTGLPDTLENRKAISWDTQTVCLQYIAGSATLDSCLVPGSPYITLDYKNAGINITIERNSLVDEFLWVGTPGQKARITLANGKYYTLYIVSGSADLSLSDNRKSIFSPPGTTATLRFSKVNSIAQEPILDTYAATYPTGLDFRYAVANDVATVTWTWDVVGTASQLLMMTWPHHRDHLVSPPSYVANMEYSTLKGIMKGVLGNSWTLRYELPTIDWFPKNPIHPSCMSELVKTLEAEVNALTPSVPGDFYFWGGSFARKAQLATIAEQVGRKDLVEKVVAVLKESVEHWFDPDHSPPAAFETGWGGVINKNGWNNTNVDFGNVRSFATNIHQWVTFDSLQAYYNDHHFHYGYLMHGGAVIGRHDPAWLNQHKQFFLHVARNTGNPSPNDPHYTVTRHMDFFAGHSWASGIANGAGSRDQESSGEAINGYYGLLLLAKSLNDTVLADWSRLLLAIEIKGSQLYWHLYPQRAPEDCVYPEQVFRDFVTVGNVQDYQAGAWLFWGGRKIQITGIQILPLTPIGVYTYDIEWMKDVLPYCQDELDDPSIGDSLKSVIHAAYSLVDPKIAYNASTELSDWGTGNSATNQLYFVSTQPSSSDICSAAAQTPEGLYYIQDVESELFITTAGNGHLGATSAVDVFAAKFELGFIPGGGTIHSESRDRYVTASTSGASALSATRQAIGSQEIFRWSLNGDGTYTLKAMTNKAFVTTSAENGELFNNANATNGITPSKYKLVPADSSVPVTLPSIGIIRSVGNNRYVSSNGTGSRLITTATETGATRYIIELVEGSPETAPYWTFQSTENNRWVTGSVSGTSPIAATAANPRSYENFQVIAYQESYILMHVVSGHPVHVQPDDTLIDDDNKINANSLWEIIEAMQI